MTLSFKSLLTAALLIATPVGAQTVHTAQGDVTSTPAGPVTAWLGLPYAAPPVGANRWRAPQPASAWTGVRAADHFAANCQQNLSGGLGPWTSEYEPHGAVSEDCLYLNIWAPPVHSKPLPVMVWIHGGAFTAGSGSVSIYNGSALAQDGIIVVTINYRVGVYGFLASPDLTREAGTSGNYGLLDQIAALQWVHDNIAAFGGDPAHVTIAGQSAGAASIHDLMISPLAKGLFQQAIAESGSGLNPGPGDFATAEYHGTALATAAGVTGLDALRQLTPEALAAAAAKSKADGVSQSFAPVIDGRVLPSASEIADVPVLTGMTANEDSYMSFFAPGIITPEAYTAEVNNRFGALAADILRLYPAATTAASRDALQRDGELAGMDGWATTYGLHAHAPVFAYLWTHAEPGPEAARYGAFHSSEISYVFRTFAASDRPYSDADHALSDTISHYWVNFVKTGDPNATGLPSWPAYTPAQPVIEEIGDRPGARPILPPATLDLLRRHLAAGGVVGRI